MRRIALCLLAVAASHLWVAEVQAEKIRLNGLSIVATGQQKVLSQLLEDDRATEQITVSLLFNTEAPRTYLAFDDQGTTLTGELERTGKDGNTLWLELNKASRKELKDAIRSLAGLSVSVKFDKVVFRVKLGDDTAKVRMKIKGTAKNDLVTVDATYKIVASGPIEIDP